MGFFRAMVKQDPVVFFPVAVGVGQIEFRLGPGHLLKTHHPGDPLCHRTDNSDVQGVGKKEVGAAADDDGAAAITDRRQHLKQMFVIVAEGGILLAEHVQQQAVNRRDALFVDFLNQGFFQMGTFGNVLDDFFMIDLPRPAQSLRHFVSDQPASGAALTRDRNNGQKLMWAENRRAAITKQVVLDQFEYFFHR